VGLKCASAVFEPLWLPPLPIVESSRRGRCSHGRCPESEYTVPCAASACPAATTTTTTITNHSDLLLLVFFFLRCHFSYFSLAVHHHAAICFEEGEKDGLGGGRVKDRWEGRVSGGGIWLHVIDSDSWFEACVFPRRVPHPSIDDSLVLARLKWEKKSCLRCRDS
jgi:hypothetical protein